MEQLPPIPTPASQRWREFRIQALPVLTFLFILAGVVTLWHQYVVPANVVGHVEMVESRVVTTLPGKLVELKVSQFERVTKGQPIGLVVATSPETTAAEIAAAQADLRVQRAQLTLNQRRAEQDHAQLLMDLLGEKIDLETAKIDLWLAKAEFERAKQQLEGDESIISRSDYDRAQATRDAAAAAVGERTKLVETMEKLTASDLTASSGTEYERAIQEAIDAESKVLSLMSEPIVLRAPVDGIISGISNHVGETVMPGVPIVTITVDSPERPKHIVGYVRQPLDTAPKVGDTVQVRRIGFQRKVDYGTVVQVGGQLEPISASLVTPSAANAVEMGLPFLVSMPPNLALVPGERVDLILNPKLRPPAE